MSGIFRMQSSFPCIIRKGLGWFVVNYLSMWDYGFPNFDSVKRESPFAKVLVVRADFVY